MRAPPPGAANVPSRLRIHLDTDIGGDSDDLCALALLLASPEVEVVGITAVADRNGGRVAFVHHALRLTGRTGIPVASGAFGFLGGFAHEPGLQDERYWPDLDPSVAGSHHDPLACAVAMGWDCLEISEIPLAVTENDGALVLWEQAGAKPLRVVTKVDSEAFGARWLETVTRL